VWLKRLATDRIARRSGAPADDTPFVIAAPVKSAFRITALNNEAARLGLKTGMALADARAMYPTLLVADADPQADQCLLQEIADWCDRYTPLVGLDAGLDAPDGLVLDVSGCAHLFGGEVALCRDLISRLGAQGFEVCAAMADTPGCAWGVARYGASRIVPCGELREALLRLPLAALRLEARVIDALAQVGLKLIADVIDLPRPPLAARFGESLIRRIDQALGREDEPIMPRLPVPPYVAEQRFADPIVLERDVLATIAHLAHELARVLERRGEGARLLQVVLFRTDGKVRRIEVGTGEPMRDAARVKRLFIDRLAAVGEASDPGFGFDVVRLSVLTAERLDPVQTGFAAPDYSADLMHLVDRLGARFGPRRVTRLVPQDTHIPEFAVAGVPAHAAGTVDERSRQMIEQDSLAPARPVRLFAQPERVEAIAEVPDGPPVRFRWRRVLHEVAHAEGPERIAMEWWRDEKGHALTRDYFRVESMQGMRVWLYREGLYGYETPQPRWFLHGLFA
jgi:protein ImuB